MGWTTKSYCKYLYPNFDAFVDEEYKGWECEFVGKGAFVNASEYYRACYDKKKNQFFALVMIVHFERDGNISYKSMTENSAPYYYNCPKYIFDIISQTEASSEYGKMWREKVAEILRRRETAKKIAVGTIIKFKNKITFSNGFQEDTFEIVNWQSGFKRMKNGERKPSFVKRFRGIETKLLYKINGWRTMDFEIVS